MREGCLEVVEASGGKVKKESFKLIEQEYENSLEAIWIAPQMQILKNAQKYGWIFKMMSKLMTLN